MPTPLAQIKVEKNPDGTVLHLLGRLDVQGTALLWQEGQKAVRGSQKGCLKIDLSQLTHMDLAGATFVTWLKRLAQDRHPQLLGETKDFSRLLALADKGKPGSSPVPLSFVAQTGQGLAASLEDARTFITFVGEIVFALGWSLCHPRSVRWKDTLAVAERTGVDALPIAALISFIVGLVMAFQAAIPMKMFAAEIYVANLIGIAMIRELGPLMTAIVLAGRSASAFAAEIGTMKINEEIDALTVMGLDPVRFLIIPRVVAATLVTPLLTVFSNLVGILGGALVILSFGYPVVTYYNQVVNFVGWEDLAGGLVKSLVFGLLIAATGCIRGYQTLGGPSAVGEATTRAVVTSIILIAVFDGIFSVVYYYLGI